MCYNPITIVNPTKYVSLKYRDRFLLQVPCGHCAQCQKNKSNEWYFRSYYQMLDTFQQNGFVLFDTLTYAPKYLPMMSDYMHVENDFPCFNSAHLRNFVARLRQRCKRKYNSNFTYFISSEYGTSERHSHRPHYHALFFVTGDISPLQFSALVAELWYYGRTDGIPYKSNNYVLNNTFTRDNFSSSLRTCKYVSKYVQKSCTFQKEIDKRINTTMHYIASRMSDDNWLESVNAARVRQLLKRRCNQFHRQSTQFGATALRDIDLNKLFKDGCLYMPDSQSVVMPIGLPTYYKRKLFYHTIKVDGNIMWHPTELGYQYLKFREKANFDNLVDRFSAVDAQFQLHFDSKNLADYVLNIRGRIKSDNPPSTIEERLQNIDFYNYVTQSDREHLGQVGLIRDFIGNSTIGYTRQSLGGHFKCTYFSSHFCFVDQEKEKQLDKIYQLVAYVDKSKQDAYELRQHLTNLYHWITS